VEVEVQAREEESEKKTEWKSGEGRQKVNKKVLQEDEEDRGVHVLCWIRERKGVFL